MVHSLEKLFSVIWCKETVPKMVIVNLFKKGGSR